MIFRNKHSFWRRRGIISLEEGESIGNKDQDLQGLRSNERAFGDAQRDQRRADPQAQTGAPPRPPVRDTPPSEEEGRQ